MTPNNSVKQILPGSYLYEAPGGSILFGIPPETVKKLFLNLELPKPKILVLPDEFYVAGNSQVDAEFILYEFLFVSAEFFKQPRRRLVVVGTKEQCQRLREILRITLIGATNEEMKRWGTSKGIRDMLLKEARYFHLKDENGRPFGIDDFVDFQIFKEDGSIIVTFDGQNNTALKKIGKNIFQINDAETVDLNFVGEQNPPYSITVSEKPVEPTCLGLHVLGSSTGFDPFNPCSGLAVWIQGGLWLIDVPPFTADILEAMGIGMSQVEGIIVTHAHNDHLSLPGIFCQDKKLKIITTVEIFNSFLIKYSATSGIKINDLKGYFDFMPITPTKPIILPGAQISAHYNAHSIPTIGVTITVIDSFGQKKSLVIGGDNISASGVKQLKDAGVINNFRYQKLLDGLSSGERPDVVMAIYDAGGAPLHGVSDDFAGYFKQLPPEIAGKIYLTHNNAGKLNEAVRTRLIKPGDFFNLVPGNPQLFDYVSIQSALALMNPDSLWLAAFMQSGSIETVSANATIITEGSEPDWVYIVLSGKLKVLVGNNGQAKKIAELQAGDIIGEMAIVRQTTRNASIVSASPARLFRIPGELFADFVSKTKGLINKLNAIWETRNFFQKVTVFAEVSAKLLIDISSHVKKETLPAGTILIHEKSSSKDCYILAEGRVSVEKDGQQITILDSGALLGEAAALGVQNLRTATIKAVDEITIYRLTAAQFKRIYDEVPSIRRRVLFTLVERGLNQ